MYLNYANLPVGDHGLPEMPELLLRTLREDPIGVISGISKLKIKIRLSEPSEMSFEIPAVLDRQKNPMFDEVIGHREIWTEHLGVYIICNPVESGDGLRKTKTVRAFSREKALENKRLFLEEGTYKFYDSTNKNNPDTVIGRILEVAVGWDVGSISQTIAQKYRTFTQYSDDLLRFIYNDAPEKFRCVFVFDTYAKTISVLDADEDRASLPIYLNYENLIQSTTVEELTDEFVTALSPYGADGLDIREVNPTGANWIYDLNYFVESGDISGDLARKYTAWQDKIVSNRAQFEGLCALRASITSQIQFEKAALAELEGELETLRTQQTVEIQALANSTKDADIVSQQSVLDALRVRIKDKKDDISEQQDRIDALEYSINIDNASSCVAQIDRIVKSLAIDKYFTKSEYKILSNYLIEQDLEDSTFVASDVDDTISGNRYDISGCTISLSDGVFEDVNIGESGKGISSITGGRFSISGNAVLEGDIIRGTIETDDNETYTISLYVGMISAKDIASSGGMITIVGNGIFETSVVSGLGIPTRVTGKTVLTTSGTLYLSANICEFKRYAVKRELFDHAAKVLAELSTPTYEFSIDTANFIFAHEFMQFKNSLQLGRGIHVNLGEEYQITPYLIEFELDYEDCRKLALVFSNRFKRHDNVSNLSDLIESSYSSSRSFDSSKHIYNQATNQATKVSQFMNSSLDVAKNKIIGAANQSVRIDGAGIHVDSTDDGCRLRIVNGMIAMSDDDWAHAKLAIGKFSSADPNISEYFGINADVIGGKLLIGNALVMENDTDDGTNLFRFDSSGAWLYNSTFVMQNQAGGGMLLSPDYGIVAGEKALFTTSGTDVYPTFIDQDKNTVLDGDGLPTNANFYLDARDGKAYFRGKITATSGKIGGFTIHEDGYLHSGAGDNFVALNGSGENTNAIYAIWAGGENPGTADFSVRKDGTIKAVNGEFSGTLLGTTFKDKNNQPMMDSNYKFTSGYLNLIGINVGNGNFVVDQYGGVTVKGNITLGVGSSINWDYVSNDGSDYSKNPLSVAQNAGEAAGIANLTAQNAQNTIAEISEIFSPTTYIGGTMIYSPSIYGSQLNIFKSKNAEPSGIGYFNLFCSNLSLPDFQIQFRSGGWIPGAGTVSDYIVFRSDTNSSLGIDFEKLYVGGSAQFSGQAKFLGGATFSGAVDFSGAQVSGITGLTATAVFA